MSQSVELSIIIVSYNTYELTKQSIDSIFEHTKGLSFEIVVVDNASTDKSVKYIRGLSKKSNVKVYFSKSNRGFAGGNNIGMKMANGRYLLLLNSDTKLTNPIFKEILSFMDSHRDVGIFSPLLKNPDGSPQASGGYFPGLAKVFSWMFFLEDVPFLSEAIKPFHPRMSYFKKERYLDWVVGAFFLMRREVYEDVGEIDEKYFMYTEEVDYSYRAKMGGWRVFYSPRWSIVHYGGASSNREYPLLQEYKGVKRFFEKYYPKWQYPLLRVFLKLGSLARVVLFGILRPSYVTIYAKAFKLA